MKQKQVVLCPEGYLKMYIEPQKFYEPMYDGDTPRPKIRRAKCFRTNILIDMLAFKLVRKANSVKKGYLTIKEAESSLHLNWIENPNAYNRICIEDVIAKHPLDLIVENDRIIAKWRQHNEL